MTNRTLYVGPRTEDVWTRAEKYAAEHEISLSSAVVRALRLMIDGVQPPEMTDERRAVNAAIRELTSRVGILEEKATGLPAS